MAVETIPEKMLYIPKWVLMLAVVASIGVFYYYYQQPSSQPAPSGPVVNGEVQWVSIADSEKLFKVGNRPILYDFNAAWCGPCQMLRREVFEDEAAGGEINKFFIPVSVTDRIREDGKNSDEAQALFNKYHITGLPTLVVKLPNGHEESVVGYHGKEWTVKFLQAQLVSMKK